MYYEDEYFNRRYDPKYNTPGLRQDKEEKQAFGKFRQKMAFERDKDGLKTGRPYVKRPKKEKEDPLWAKRLFIVLATPTLVAVFFGIGYLIMLNVSDVASAAKLISAPVNSTLTEEEIRALPPIDRLVYTGRKKQARMQYREARKDFLAALELDPDHFVANSGLYTTLLELAKKDRGWQTQLYEQEKKMKELR